MTETTTADLARRRPSWVRTVVAFGRRDLRVLRSQLPSFVIRTSLQPLLFTFVFAYILPKTGQGLGGFGTDASFGTILLPGLVAVALIIQGGTSVALSLAVELTAGHATEDRIMAPAPPWLLGVELILFGAAQSILGALIVFPLAYFIPATPVDISVASWPILITVVILAGLISGAMGLVLGTILKPQHLGMVFSVFILPLSLLGCIYYPWATLDEIRWLQIVVLINPLVYVSEGLRAALTPQTGHMQTWAFLGGQVVALVLVGWVGLRSFVRQAVR